MYLERSNGNGSVSAIDKGLLSDQKQLPTTLRNRVEPNELYSTKPRHSKNMEQHSQKLFRAQQLQRALCHAAGTWQTAAFADSNSLSISNIAKGVRSWHEGPI